MLRNSLLINKGTIKSQKFGEDIINTGSRTFNLPSSFRYTVMRVTPAFIARPDLLSYKLYGSDMYGDLLCKINGISNPFELNEGMVIVVPEYSYINEFLSIDVFDDDSTEKTFDINSAPTAKTRKEKRKPNEAIIGDTRFKIDKVNRVIVY